MARTLKETFLRHARSSAGHPFFLRRSRNVIYALAIFAGLALALWRGNSLYSQREDQIQTALMISTELARDVVEDVARALDTAELLANDTRNFIQSNGGTTSVDRVALQHYIASRTATRSLPDFILVVDRNGQPVAVSERDTPPNVNLRDRIWFKAHQQQGQETYLGQAIQSRIGRNTVFTYSKTLYALNGQFDGVVDVDVGLRDVHPLSTRRPRQPLKQVWKGDGTLIMSNLMAFDANGNLKPQTAPFIKRPEAKSGFLPTSDSNVMIAFMRNDHSDLISTVTIYRNEVLARWHEDVRVGFVLFALAIMVGGLLAKLAADLAETDLNARLAIEQTVKALSGALAQRDLLLKEIHHRVKNNLQLTSSLIQLQSREFHNPEVRTAFRETQQRLHAIGMIHDALYLDDTKPTIDMHGYLSRLAAEIARTHDAANRFIVSEVSIDDVELLPEQATPLGLLTTEILIHAYKMDYPETGGLIEIKLIDQDSMIRLEIICNGTGETIEVHNGLAMKLVRNLSSQLRGSYAFDQQDVSIFRLSFRKVIYRSNFFPNTEQI